MRAIAVVAVFGYHLWPSLIRGGFVGVDVFFVISGFLITGHAGPRGEATGRIRVGRFYARRIKRLLPAALTVLVGHRRVAVYVLGAPNLWPQFMRRDDRVRGAVRARTGSSPATRSTTWPRPTPPSPVQHFWTLSVEEQFYIFTPLLLIALLVVARRFGTPRRRVLWAGSRRSRRRASPSPCG